VSDATTEIVGTEDKKDQLNGFYHFPTVIYSIDKPEFLDDAKNACKKAIAKRKKDAKLDEIYPVYMTDNLFEYKGMDKLSQYIGQTAWNILSEQGYAMNDLNTVFTEFWCQEHHKLSGMDQHVHGYGSQIVGFYFVDCPEDCSRVVFHDPRAGKVQINLPETNMVNATAASNLINFEPKEGMMMFTNAWLAHSFTRHSSNKPIRFIHFNLTVQQSIQLQVPAPAEVV